MKKKIFLVFSVMMVLGLAVAIFALNTSSRTERTAMSCCCCSGDSCPLKDKNAAARSDAAATTDGCSCCGDSCPMKKSNDAKTGSASGDMKDCPMMKAHAGDTMRHDAKVGEDGKAHSCSCCEHGMDKKDAPAV